MLFLDIYFKPSIRFSPSESRFAIQLWRIHKIQHSFTGILSYNRDLLTLRIIGQNLKAWDLSFYPLFCLNDSFQFISGHI